MSKFLARAGSVKAGSREDTAVLKGLALQLKNLGVVCGLVRVPGFRGTRVSIGFPPGGDPKKLAKALKDINLVVSGKPEFRGDATPFKDQYGNKYFVMLSPHVQWIVVDRSNEVS